MTVIARKTGLVGLLLLSIVFFHPSAPALASGAPHLLYGGLATAGGATPDIGEVTLVAFVTARPGEKLTDAGPGCGYANGKWWIEAGNFPTPWQIGDSVTVSVTNNDTDESATQTLTLDGNGQQTLALVVPGGGGVDDADDDGSGGNDTNNCFIGASKGRGPVSGLVMLLMLGLLAAAAMAGSPALRCGRGFRKGLIRGAGRALTLAAALSVSPLMAAGTAEAAQASFDLSVGKNAISMPLANTAVQTAAQLLAAVEGAESVAYWNAATQSYVTHVKGAAENNFAIQPSFPYVVTMSGDFIWNIAGDSLPKLYVDLITTNTTNINAVAAPLSRSDITKAEQLCAEIPNCDTVWFWDVERQGYVGHPKGTQINNFPITPGHSYFVNVTHDSTWNQSGGGEIDYVYALAPGGQLAFSMRLTQQMLADMQLPLAYSLKRVIRGDQQIEPPAGLTVDAVTGRVTWTPAVAHVGEYVLEVEIADADGHAATEMVYVSVAPDAQLISNVSASDNFITPAAEPAAGETVTISYTLSEAAAVTVDIYRAWMRINEWGDGGFQREFLRTIAPGANQAAGAHMVTFNGLDAGGQPLEPGACIYVIRALTADGRQDIYGLEYVGGGVSIANTSVAVIEPEPANEAAAEPDTDFDPYVGERVRIQYNLYQPAWVTIGGPSMRGFAIEAAPRSQGINTEIWDGRNTTGEVVGGVILDLRIKAELLPENAIVVQADTSRAGVVAAVTAEPYVMSPAYGEVSLIQYTLAQNATVSIAVGNSRGGQWTVLEPTAQTAGAHTFRWDGAVPGGMIWPSSENATAGAAGPQDDYTITVKALDENGRTISSRRTNVHAYR